MRAIKKEDLQNIVYYQTPKWLFDLLLEGKITPGAYATYVLMYDRTRLSAMNNWIDKDGDVFIKYSYEEMLVDLKVNSKTQISRNLKKLEELNLIEKKRNFSSSNTFYLNIYNDSHSSTQNVLHSSTQNVLHSSTQNVYANKNNLINNNLKRTTTKKKTEKSSSSLEIYLKEKGFNEKTITNITKLDVTLERVKEVVNHAEKNKLGVGYVVDALKSGYEIAKEKKQTVSGKRSIKSLGEQDLIDSMSPEEREHKELEAKVYEVVKSNAVLKKAFYKATMTLEKLKKFIVENNIEL